MKDVSCFSFTSDIWSTGVSNDSLLSLTAHWLTQSFERRYAMLHAQSLPGSHTGEMICSKYKAMFEEWDIKKEQLHLFVVDNASNMRRAMLNDDFPYIGCFSHTLQLIVNDGVLSQRYVKDIVATCHHIVGHFKRSQLACSRLKEIQASLGTPLHRLRQDVATRWNSTLYMLESIAEQKMALAAYAAECSDIPQLSVHQLSIIDKIIALLKPIEDITQSISSEKASASMMIPFVRALRKNWEDIDDDRGVQTMKEEMLSLLNRRYSGIESNESLVLAMILDPCFKDKFFSGIMERADAKVLLETKVAETLTSSTVSTSAEATEPPEKRAKTDITKVFDEIIEEAGASTGNTSASSLVDTYLAEPLLPYHSGNAYTWWKENGSCFKPLSCLALKYLSAPPTSVPSERLFSVAGDIYDEKRNRLTPERAETLLFIKSNFHLL